MSYDPYHDRRVMQRQRSGLIVPHQFRQPVAQLHPYLKECVHDLEKHGFCHISAQLIEDRGICTSDQLEMFREACRNVSNELDRELKFEDKAYAPDLAVYLAEKNEPGDLPDDPYVEDPDGKGVLETTPAKRLLV